jgi:two-component system, cell cycle sensor histidine kinase and response regulator CckA
LSQGHKSPATEKRPRNSWRERLEAGLREILTEPHTGPEYTTSRILALIEAATEPKDTTVAKTGDSEPDRNTDRLFRQVFEFAGDYSLILRPVPGGPPIIQDLNAAALKVHGYSRDEIVGRPITAIDRAMDPAAMLALQRQLDTDGIATFTVSHGRKDGSIFEAEVVASRIRMGDEDLILAVERDVTERKRADAALAASERKYRSLVEHLHVGVFLSTPGGRLLHANPATLRCAGYASLEEFLAIPAERLYANPQDRRRFLDQLTQTGHVEDFETLSIRQDGTLYPVLLGAMLLRGEAGRPDALLGTIEDISESKRASEQLLILKSSIDCAPHAAYWFNPEGRFIYVNDAGCRALGYSMDELLQLHVSDVNPRATAGRWAAVWQAIKASGVTTIESVHRRKDGTEFPVEVVSAYFRHGDHEYCNGFALDLTERHRIDRERAALQAQLLEARKLESVGRLAGGVAHDFNNMLSVILGNAELALRRGDLDLRIRHSLSGIRLAAQRSAELTQQLLAFARRQTVVPRVLDLNQAVDEPLNLLRRLIGEEITLSWQAGNGLWPVKLDPSQLSQVLTNLVVNARDAITGVGTISISTSNATLDDADSARYAGSRHGDYVVLCVRDDGRGMTQDVLEHIFEPFYTTKDRGAGTGLGLATVYGITTQNGGFVAVESKPDAGSSFSIYLPRHSGQTDVLAVEAAAKDVPRGRETILLVEDEPAVLEMSCYMLEHQGYTVLVAGSPSEAIRLAEGHGGQIDLLLTDVVMPEMNGRELARKLVSRRPDMGQLFMSGYTADVIAHHDVLQDGLHFLQKPFSVDALAAKVREALASRVAVTPPVDPAGA